MVARSAVLSGAGLDLRLSTREVRGSQEHWLTGLTGWFGGVGVKGENTERPLGHGVFPLASTRTGRVLTLRGTLVFADERDRLVADRFLSGLLWDGEFGSLTVDTDGLELTARVKLDGEIKHDYLGTHALKVEVPLLAPDPFLYSEPRTYQAHPAGFGIGLDYPLGEGGKLDYGATENAQTVIRNGGNADAWPTVAVRGDFPAGVRVSSGGKAVEFRAPIFSQSPVFIDMAEGAITVNGMDQTHRATLRDWWHIPPGGSVQPTITALEPGNGWADVRVSDTYI